MLFFYLIILPSIIVGVCMGYGFHSWQLGLLSGGVLWLILWGIGLFLILRTKDSDNDLPVGPISHI